MQNSCKFLFSMGLLFSTIDIAVSCEPASYQLEISDVYPTSDTLPENLLRFYIYFSKPMRRENILSSIYLTDSKGQKIEGVFLENRFNLWSSDSTRLTILFDPGRVKTGLVAHKTMGRALTPGRDYKLVIDTSAKDFEGCTLMHSYEKVFSVIGADFSVPDIRLWSLSKPVYGSYDDLVIDMNGYMDHLSLAYRIRIIDADKEVVGGELRLAQNEQQWILAPEEQWNKPPYTVEVEPVLEDIAGNRITGLFEQPL